MLCSTSLGMREVLTGAGTPEVRSLEGHASFSVPAGKADRKMEVTSLGTR